MHSFDGVNMILSILFFPHCSAQWKTTIYTYPPLGIFFGSSTNPVLERAIYVRSYSSSAADPCSLWICTSFLPPYRCSLSEAIGRFFRHIVDRYSC
ncbi:hypothetical protein C8R44DRAFT_249302 [Mycena epipterygia]|nr:hypothetical protein C8R44DRAFT_252276 [Mycena epipterygia]KAJ7112622.1 hypothetical protein C8R44DRAFT_249302 [Mycena epipterygia]